MVSFYRKFREMINGWRCLSFIISLLKTSRFNRIYFSQAVANNMQIRCKCHGMSGSCQLKTCWKSAPDFRVVGKVLKKLFRKAVLVDQSNMGNGSPLIISKGSHKRKSQSRNVGRLPRKTVRKHKKVGNLQKMENSLFYYQRSPNFCDKDPSSDIQGM